jgi:hypothetical protein
MRSTNHEDPLCVIFYTVLLSLPPLGPNIFLSTLFSGVINLCSCLDVRGQVSYLYKRTQAKWHCIAKHIT